MKKNSGFSLIEILAIIVIIGIITAVSIPNIKKLIAKEDEATENMLNRKIENAAHLYAAKHYADKIVSDAFPIEFGLDELEQEGFLQLNDGECSGVAGKIKIYSAGGIKYDYSDIEKNNIGVENCFKCNGDCKRK